MSIQVSSPYEVCATPWRVETQPIGTGCDLLYSVYLILEILFIVKPSS